MKPNCENTKNAITVSLSSNQTMSGQKEILNCNKILAQIGNKLSLKNGGILIGSGISTIKVSANLNFNGGGTVAGDMLELDILKNNETFVRACDYVPNESNPWGLVVCSPTVMNVQEGDVIYLQAWENQRAGATIRAVMDTYLTIEVIE